MNSIWIVYRPSMGYEDSETTYFACATQEKALESQKIMLDFLTQKLEASPKINFPVGWYNLPLEERDQYTRKSVEKAEWINAIKDWPFDINLSEWLYTEKINDDCVSIVEIPLY